ncbi:uncharacterized protein METZ01_LOCUS312454 [marine metagenome]|uniref:Uncharacterized protein n=1 Tax=marine metagenome TaxID=408172 RepID=A0A382NFX0_9ZZZZ
MKINEKKLSKKTTVKLELINNNNKKHKLAVAKANRVLYYALTPKKTQKKL